MKLIIAIVSNDDSVTVTNALMEKGYIVTRLATTGGFLRAGNTTLLLGTDDEKVPMAMEIIKNESKRREEVVPASSTFDIDHYSAFPITVTVGGATIFVLDVDQFVKV